MTHVAVDIYRDPVTNRSFAAVQWQSRTDYEILDALAGTAGRHAAADDALFYGIEAGSVTLRLLPDHWLCRYLDRDELFTQQNIFDAVITTETFHLQVPGPVTANTSVAVADDDGPTEGELDAEATRLDLILRTVRREVEGAVAQYQRFNSPHEAWAVIREEVDELWDEVKANRGTGSSARGEAVQVAAMAIRYLLDFPDKAEIAKLVADVLDEWPDDEFTREHLGEPLE